MQKFIEKLKIYCEINSLQIAVNKCSTLHVGPNNPNHEYSLSNSLIPNIQKGESVRDLGVHFSADLKWRSHIDIIVKKARRTSFALLRSLKSNDPNLLINLFKIYVIPILEFSCPIFNPYYQKDIESVEKVQRDYIRIVYRRSPHFHKNPKDPSYADLLTTFGIESLESRRLKFCLTFFHKCLYGLVPATSTSLKFVPSKTRGISHKIMIPNATKDARFNSFFLRFSRIYRIF